MPATSLPEQKPGRRLPTPAPDKQARLAGLLVLIAGLTGIISGLLPPDHRRIDLLARNLGLPTAGVATAASVVLGVVLVLLARGLRRRQRRAWVLAVPVLALGALAHLLKGLDFGEGIVALVALVVLVRTRDQFRAAPDPRPRRRPLLLFAGLLGFAVLAGLASLNLRDSSILGSPSLGQQLQQVLMGLVGVAGPVRYANDQANDLVSATLLGLGLLTIAVPVAVALKPSPGRVGQSAEEREAVRALLQRPDCDSLGWFALRDDKSLVFSPSGKAAVGYRVEGGVALASGDPVGDPEAWPGALAEFLDLADRSGWLPAVLGCGTRGATAWNRAGLSALEIGDEAVIEPADFSLEGREMRGVRQAVNRVRRAGWTTQIRRVGDLSPDEVVELRALSDSWRDGTVERGFSMALGRFGGAGDEGCVVITAHKDGEVGALLHFVPWAKDGLSLDLMRRARGSDNGINELLIVDALAGAAALGVRRVSLNFAVFRSALEQGAKIGAGPVLRAWRGTLLFASKYWQIDTLYRFNAKFGPTWQPRYVCYRRTADLPRVMVAGLQAEAFLPRLRLPGRGAGDSPEPACPLPEPVGSVRLPAAADTPTRAVSNRDAE